MADLCCDHGYLGLWAYETENFPEIHFVDVSSFAMELLEKNFHQYVKKDSNQTQVYFYTADAGRMETPLTGNVVIAGVGGYLMMRMLESLHERGMLRAERLILSPHRHEEQYEKPELFGYQHSHTVHILETGYQRPIFVFDSKK